MSLEKVILEEIKYSDLDDTDLVKTKITNLLSSLGFFGVSFNLVSSKNTGRISITPLNLLTAVVFGENGNVEKDCLNEAEYNNGKGVIYRYYDGEPCKVQIRKVDATFKIQEED